MKIAIIGTRGIPNHYGGFEQFAEYLSEGLAKLGHKVIVYNSHNHPYQKKSWNGVEIVHCYDPEYKLGTAGQFIYDLNCIVDSRKKNYDIILQLGYTSSSIWGWLLPRKRSFVVTNMDGLEWKRTKYSKKVQRFLCFAEKLGIKYSDLLVSDSVGIQQYILSKYQKQSTYIPYGAHIFAKPDNSILNNYNIQEYAYNMLIARLEPENSVEVILDGVALSKTKEPFLVIGNHETLFGKYLKDKFVNNKNIKFLGGIYDINILNNLRYFSKLYFHGHTVGGTNPSLLEAMASNSLICAHNNVFNKSILGEDALYFENKEDVASAILNTNKSQLSSKVASNIDKILKTYSWTNIVRQYNELFLKIK